MGAYYIGQNSVSKHRVVIFIPVGISSILSKTQQPPTCKAVLKTSTSFGPSSSLGFSTNTSDCSVDIQIQKGQKG